MNRSKFLELRDVTQGDFAIQSGKLFYKEKLIASAGQPILISSEEVFFLFETSGETFSKVIFRNFEWPAFFKCSADLLFGKDFLQFIDEQKNQHAFRLVSYNGGNTTKSVGSNFVKKPYFL